jgi:hypothetical protein
MTLFRQIPILAHAAMASVRSVDNNAKQTIFGFSLASVEKNELSGVI